MGQKIPVIAIVGRTNVGKSSLFNALVGRRVAVVEDQPGVTRDRNYSLVTRYGFPFTLVDTGGFVGEEDEFFRTTVRDQAIMAIEQSDLVVVLFDGIQGVHPLDSEVTDYLRRSKKQVLWVINKCERPETEAAASEFYSLGIEEFHFVSAAHRKGIKDLAKLFQSILKIKAVDETDLEAVEEKLEDREIRVAIIGKPNTGKSTLVNKIVGEDRVIASEKAGTTRDSVNIPVLRDGQRYSLIDTAGLRKKAKVDSRSVERYSNFRSLKVLSECDVAVLLLDASDGPPVEQDARLAGLIHERGRGLVIVVNKWDAIEKDHRSAKAYKDSVHEAFKFAPYAPVLFVSALTGRGCPKILDKVKTVLQASRERIKTSDVNKLLKVAFQKKPPPVYRGEPIKLYFATQISVSPPSFVLFVNHPEKLGFSYHRYIKNTLRKEYPFEGSDIKLIFKKRTSKQAAAHYGA